ncbi:MAG: hypothetical protein WD057_08275 [Aquisalimonadaceae bacterium]
MNDQQHPVTRSMVIDAVQHHMNDWSMEMRFAIRALPAPTVSDQGLKAATWLAFGLNATHQLYPQFAPVGVRHNQPGRLLLTGLRRVSPQLWALSQVQQTMARHYRAQLRNADEKLFGNYLQFQDAFIRTIQQINDNFIDSAYGRAVIDAVFDHFKEGTYERDTQATRIVRDAIISAGLVEKDPHTIRTRVREGFGRLLEKTEMIFRGSPDAPGTNRLQFATSDSRHWRTVPFSHPPVSHAVHKWTDVQSQRDALWLMANAYKMKVWRDERHYRTSGGMRIPTTYVVYAYPNEEPEHLLPLISNPRPEIRNALAALPKAA